MENRTYLLSMDVQIRVVVDKDQQSHQARLQRVGERSALGCVVDLPTSELYNSLGILAQCV